MEMLLSNTGCWEAWEAGTCLRVGVAVARWCVSVRASLHMEPLGRIPFYHLMLQDTPDGEGQLQPVITRVVLSYRHASSSVISCWQQRKRRHKGILDTRVSTGEGRGRPD
ncbi:uncharacterized protein [Fopius arisanus]|uniref:Uncharacterized protein n=1 Tax=Fopius arisanus TaxID=64838 RepID=A0A9R1TXJ5_9HYME|nr:PREDICTED: uncharacterized protein LOC105264804 [Fopius arisanus]